MSISGRNFGGCAVQIQKRRGCLRLDTEHHRDHHQLDHAIHGHGAAAVPPLELGFCRPQTGEQRVDMRNASRCDLMLLSKVRQIFTDNQIIQ